VAEGPGLGPADAEAFERTIRDGGVVLFPADTVYGLACDPENADAIADLYALKGRPARQPAAVMWFDREAALAALPELGERTRAAAEALLPGGVTLLLPNPGCRYRLACAGEGTTIGIRVPELAPATAALNSVGVPVLQTSANPAGGSEALRFDEVETAIADGVDLALDGGELPGVASTVIDLCGYEAGDGWSIVREGAVPRADLVATLGPDDGSAA
jgi:L-threonylcarbamoyladenylate synthase